MARFTGTEGDTLSVEPPLHKSLCNCTQMINTILISKNRLKVAVVTTTTKPSF